MIKNYIKVTIRNMVRNKLFTSINIFGMSVSLACCMLLFFYATNELSFDKHHGPTDYRLNSTLSQKDGEMLRITFFPFKSDAAIGDRSLPVRVNNGASEPTAGNSPLV